MDSIWNLWNYVEYVESTWNLWGSVKYTKIGKKWAISFENGFLVAKTVESK